MQAELWPEYSHQEDVGPVHDGTQAAGECPTLRSNRRQLRDQTSEGGKAAAAHHAHNVPLIVAEFISPPQTKCTLSVRLM